MNNYFSTDVEGLKSFVRNLKTNHDIFATSKNGEHLFWKKIGIEDIDTITPNYYRALNPIKSFLFPIKEEVTKEPASKKTIILGAKACDIEHLKTMDSIFLQGVLVDPYYEIKRKNLVIISADCDAFKPSCFCTSIGNKPYPETNFDINISKIGNNYVLETATKAGEDLVKSGNVFQTCSKELLNKRSWLRKEITLKVENNNKDFSWSNPREIVENTFASNKWEEDIASTCVECDACRFNCGTCYCFVLSDMLKSWDKIRSWDSCQSTGYGRVAGGANPRKTKGERLRNFYMCKLSYRPSNFGFYACTGCGRCIEVCQGKIDIRNSLQKLHQELSNKNV